MWKKRLMKVFFDVVRTENDRITKRVSVGECARSQSVGRSRKREIDTVKDYLKKRCFDVKRARRMGHDRNVWRGFVWENVWGVARGMDP